MIFSPFYLMLREVFEREFGILLELWWFGWSLLTGWFSNWRICVLIICDDEVCWNSGLILTSSTVAYVISPEPSVLKVRTFVVHRCGNGEETSLLRWFELSRYNLFKRICTCSVELMIQSMGSRGSFANITDEGMAPMDFFIKLHEGEGEAVLWL